MSAEPVNTRTVKARRSLYETVRRDLAKAPISAWLGMIIILIYAICAVFAPLIAPYGEAEILGKAYQPSSAAHWLGTDQLGRDLFRASSTVPATPSALRCSPR